jgi:hypothetical protein
MGLTKKVGKAKNVNSRIIQAKLTFARIFCAVVEGLFVNKRYPGIS